MAHIFNTNFSNGFNNGGFNSNNGQIGGKDIKGERLSEKPMERRLSMERHIHPGPMPMGPMPMGPMGRISPVDRLPYINKPHHVDRPMEYPPNPYYQNNHFPHRRLFNDSFTRRPPFGIQNEAKRRIDAALGLLKLRKFGTYF